ncbi:Flp pilus assembly protein CpaB [Marinobacter sp. SS21]|uniref:Flp pilus assembly protein CpaB n=1 Tax=Marinobacter sp. SS21 TaxID=2979460 RepID=UPI00232E6FC1|nr:Flp pilus assembly protein CpaB [Marinobacter sp. SS21]MDC0661251.1 Flp pilus assembly protein CpaB [Marinobacter sp. SS21]
MNSKLLYTLPALLLALVAVVLALVGVLRPPHSPQSQPDPATGDVAVEVVEASPPAPSYDYLVARVAMSPGDALEATSVQRISSDHPIDGAILADDLQFGAVVSNVVRAGELMREGMFESASLVRPLLQPGTQAIAIPVNDVSGVGGLLKPGDEVNVYASFRNSDKNEPAALTVLENVVVIAVRGVAYSGDAVDEDERRRNASVVLAVPDDKVASLLLASNEGELRLAALADTGEALDVAALPVSPAKPTYLKDLFPAPPPPPRTAPSRPTGSRVQVFEGAEQRSVYVR